MFVNRERTMLHIRQCQHLGSEALAKLEPATSEQIEALPTCSSCRNILDHGGRSTYPTLDVAMEALPVPVANRPRVREIARGLEYRYIWRGIVTLTLACGDAPRAVPRQVLIGNAGRAKRERQY